MKVRELTDKQSEKFTEAFYKKWPFKYDDLDSPKPWGYPWFYDENRELIGETIEEMAENYFNSQYKEILSQIAEIEYQELEEIEHHYEIDFWMAKGRLDMSEERAIKILEAYTIN